MSKFKGVFEVAKQREREEDKKKLTPESSTSNVATKKLDGMTNGEIPHEIAKEVPSKRPKGKRNNPEYEQVSAYIRKRTYKGVKLALMQEGKGRDFSDLVEDVLDVWLKTRSY